MMLLPLIILQLFVFAGLLLLLRFILTRHATQATGHLTALGQEAVLQQETLKKRLEEAERQYHESLSKAKEEADQLKARMLQEVEGTRQQLMEQSRQEAERIVQQGIKAKEAIQGEMESSIEARAVERACRLIEQALPEGLREAVHEKWLDELVKNGLIPVDRLQTSEKVEEVVVTCAFPLTPGQRKILQERLDKVLGFSVRVKEMIDPQLVAGLVVTVGHLVLDGSLASQVRKAARHAESAGD